MPRVTRSQSRRSRSLTKVSSAHEGLL
jgi:hypothetical protein